MKNKKNEELQSRREFFKKAAKGALPIWGSILFASAPTIVKATNVSMGCPGSCYMQCDGGCRQSCKDGCKYQCKTTCKGGCGSTCRGTCQYSAKGAY